jgi:hypothetical protein
MRTHRAAAFYDHRLLCYKVFYILSRVENGNRPFVFRVRLYFSTAFVAHRRVRVTGWPYIPAVSWNNYARSFLVCNMFYLAFLVPSLSVHLCARSNFVNAPHRTVPLTRWVNSLLLLTFRRLPRISVRSSDPSILGTSDNP